MRNDKKRFIDPEISYRKVLEQAKRYSPDGERFYPEIFPPK